MFKNHPKGLLPAALANMGERFGFYVMMALLTLFLQTKFGLDGKGAGIIYSSFYFLIYALALVGGIIADKTKNFKGTILAGLVTMGLGYLLLSYPTPTPVPADKFYYYLGISCFALFVIAFGNGLFKGNLQALVGQMYDDEKHAPYRDAGFNIFYMFINIGSIFAPAMAVGIRNWWVLKNGFEYESSLPDLCHAFLRGDITAEGSVKLEQFAQQMNFSGTIDQFVNDYLNVFTTGFHYAFAIAIVAMAISLVIYLINKNGFPDPAKKAEDIANGNAPKAPDMPIQEVRQRIYALLAVFAVVIFFWFSFHQNGLTLTFFAKDYTDLSGLNFNLGFTTLKGAELFQSINPFFVVFLTPIVMSVFAWLRSKGKEPSTAKKIAIGMGIAATAYVVMSLGSIGLPLKSEVEAMGGLDDVQRVSPWLLVLTYAILTTAELFISPLGISFVSKVAPPQFQGIMQGLWLLATGLGNQLLFIGAIFYNSIPLSYTWLIFVGACCISMLIMLFMLKWLERVSGETKEERLKAAKQ